MLKHVMGVVMMIATWQAIGGAASFIAEYIKYGFDEPMAFVLQFLLVAAFAGVAILIYRRWFRGWLYPYLLVAVPPPIIMILLYGPVILK